MFHCSFAAYLNNCMGSLWAAGMRVSLAVPGMRNMRNGSVHGKPWSSRTNSQLGKMWMLVVYQIGVPEFSEATG